MKQILLHISLLITVCTTHAQITITTTWPTSFTDALSQNNYTSINNYNRARNTKIISNVATSYGIRDVMNSQYEELTNIHLFLRTKAYSIKKFISGTQFNSTWGYNSYGYIQEKYPIINPLSPSSAFKNSLIRMRFYKKFNDESKKIDNYLNSANPIPEGERILLILTSLENVINITLENEAY